MPGREGFSGSACWIFNGAMNFKDLMDLDQRSLMTRLANSSLLESQTDSSFDEIKSIVRWLSTVVALGGTPLEIHGDLTVC